MRRNYDDSKMYTYVKGYAMGKGWTETILALNYARKLHKGQTRKSGEPYICHPLTMACHALALGIESDVVIATLLLHDVVEDCQVSVNDLPCNEMVKKSVSDLTFVKPLEYLEKDGVGPSLASVKEEYYKNISKNAISTICKLFDRCHNVSSMAGTFTKAKLEEYIDETDTFVLPLIRQGKDNFPKYTNIFFVLKYHIISVLDAIVGTIDTYN